MDEKRLKNDIRSILEIIKGNQQVIENLLIRVEELEKKEEKEKGKSTLEMFQ